MSHISFPDKTRVLPALRLRWLFYAFFCLGFVMGGYLFLRTTWQPERAFRWMYLACLALVYLLVITWRSLPLNYPLAARGEDPGYVPVPSPSLGAANTLTLLRGVLIAGLAGFLFSPWPTGWLAWLPGILYLVASLGDFLDGILARLSGQVTRLGEVLDMEFDVLGVLVTVVLVIQYGQAPGWYVLVALARYLFVGALWLRLRLGLPVYELPFSVRRRTLAGIQMGVLGMLLLPVFGPPGTLWVTSAFGIPLLAGFLWDWLLVIGKVKETAQSAREERRFAGWAGFALRWAAVCLILVQRIYHPDTWGGFPVLGALEMLIGGMIVLGVSGRVWAIFGLVSLGVLQSQNELTVVQLFLSLAYSGILMLGTGMYSLWAPEERLVFHRLGDPGHLDQGKPE
jgi:CDP-diacylglycerol---glycerol-3-phosphate 3-phosphatidyltransferase